MEEPKYIGTTGRAYDRLGGVFGAAARACPLSANTITLLSFALWIAACGLLAVGEWVGCLVLATVASLGDGFDGMVAREQGQQGDKGAFLDFYADRVSDVLFFSVLAYLLRNDLLAFVPAVASVGLSQLSCMFRNGLKTPEDLAVRAGIDRLRKAFLGLNLRRAVVGLGMIGSLAGYPLLLALSLWVVAAWSLVSFTTLYGRVTLLREHGVVVPRVG